MEEKTIMRTFLEFAEAITQEKAGNIKAIIDNNDLILFFKFNKDLFGTTEESRVVFARMKNPSTDNSTAWRKEAGFTGLNLSKTVTSGERKEQMFEFKDLKNIQIVEKEEVIHKLEKEKVKNTDITTIVQIDKEVPANMDDIDEK